MGKTGRILLVDDDEITNFYNQKIIEKSGYDFDVQVATNVEQALDYLESKNSFTGNDYLKPFIIFLDINMPGLTGWDFMERYVDLPKALKAKTVIVMLTTSLNPDDRNKADTFDEINDFFAKPLTVGKLKTLVERT